MANLRTGISVAAKVAIHLCKVLTTYRSAIDGVVAGGVTSGAITSGQAADIKTWLDAASAACTALKLLTGY